MGMNRYSVHLPENSTSSSCAQSGPRCARLLPKPPQTLHQEKSDPHSGETQGSSLQILGSTAHGWIDQQCSFLEGGRFCSAGEGQKCQQSAELCLGSSFPNKDTKLQVPKAQLAAPGALEELECLTRKGKERITLLRKTHMPGEAQD